MRDQGVAAEPAARKKRLMNSNGRLLNALTGRLIAATVLLVGFGVFDIVIRLGGGAG